MRARVWPRLTVLAGFIVLACNPDSGDDTTGDTSTRAATGVDTEPTGGPAGPASVRVFAVGSHHGA